MAFLQQFLLSLSFLTRLPIAKQRDFTGTTLAQSVWAFPIVGAITGKLAALAYLLLLSLGVLPGIAAWIALAALIWLTGGLHEDGLADMADGLAHGRTREQKLAIMRDSRIGSFGVLALIATLAIRASAMAACNGWQALWIFATAGACSRSCVAVMMYILPPARTDGLAMQAGKPALPQTLAAVALGVFSLIATAHLRTAIASILLLVATGLLIKYTAQKHFGGVTGDVLGATQQLSEVALLVVLTSLHG